MDQLSVALFLSQAYFKVPASVFEAQREKKI